MAQCIKHLLTKPTNWVVSEEPTWWKERTDFWKLSSDLYIIHHDISTFTYFMNTDTQIHTLINKVKNHKSLAPNRFM